MRYKLAALLIIGSLVLLVAACGFGAGDSNPVTAAAAQRTMLAKQTASASQQTAGPRDTATKPPASPERQSTTPGTPIPGSGTPTPAGALPRIAPPADLESFRLMEELRMEGTTPDGSELSENTTTTVEFVAEPLALHAVVATELGGMEAFLALLGFEDSTLEVFADEDGTYMGLFGSWLYTSAEAMGKGLDMGGWSFETNAAPTDFSELPLDLPQVGYAGTYTVTRWLRQVVHEGEETYNGVAVSHYVLDQDSFDPQAMPAGMVVDAATGDLYLAEDDDYVVFLDVTLEGDNLAAPTGAGEHRLQKGIFSYSSSLTAINEPLTIEVPDQVLEATGLPEDIPVPDGLHQILGGELMGMRMFAFLADGAPAEIVSFYTSAMPEYGWVQDTVEETGDAYKFEYSKGNRSILVDISVESDAGKTLLSITADGADGFFSIFQGE